MERSLTMFLKECLTTPNTRTFLIALQNTGSVHNSIDLKVGTKQESQFLPFISFFNLFAPTRKDHHLRPIISKELKK